MRRAETSYAAALLALAETPADARRCGEVLGEYAAAFEENALLRRVLHNPVLPRAFKKQVLTRIIAGDAPQTVLNCVRLMVDKGRIGLLPGVAVEYERQRAVLEGTLVIRIHSAVPLSGEETQRVCALFSARYGASGTRVETVLDPKLIGGIRVQVGDMLYDQSLAGRLSGLRRAIGEELQ